MFRWVVTLSVWCILAAYAQYGSDMIAISASITDEVVNIKDPIEKTGVNIGFSQCKNVKKILDVDYGQYQGDPDMSKLALNFITDEISMELQLPALSSVLWSKWFTARRGIIIYLHGFTDDPTKDSYKNISHAFLLHGTDSVVALDASSLIRWFYLRASTMVRFIGQELGNALSEMIKAGLNPASIYLVGHSLGAHIASFTGKTVLSQTGYRVGRISGLDPAGPCFSDIDLALRLNKDDALYVDVIHTDAGVYGLDRNVGHADYYPNCGSEQPGCFFQTCSHSRAWVLFAESVMNPTGFPAVSCSSCNGIQKGLPDNCNYGNTSFMGYGSRPGTVGQFYLHTADASPYALGPEGIQFTNHSGFVNSFQNNVETIVHL